MAFNVVQVGATVSNGGSGATTMTVSLTGVTPGNSLIIFAPAYGTGGVLQTVTASGFVASNIPNTYDNNTAGNILVQASSAGGNVTVTLNVVAYDYVRATMVEVSGLAASPVDVVFGASSNEPAGTLTASSTTATAQATEVLIGMQWIGGSGAYPVPPAAGFTTIYTDNTSGPSSQGAFQVLSTVQTPSMTWSNGSSGTSTGLMGVTMILANNNLALTSKVVSSTTVLGNESITISSSAASNMSGYLGGVPTLSGYYNSYMQTRTRIKAAISAAYFTSTQEGFSQLLGTPVFITPNTTNLVQTAVTQQNSGGSWTPATLALTCNSGDSLIVVTVNNNKNASGTYLPTVNNGSLAVIYDEEVTVIGSSYPVFIQMLGMFYIKAGTYTFTPPNEGTNGSGSMYVLRISGIIGVRPNSVATVLNNYGASSTYYTSVTNSSGSGTQQGDFLLGIATTKCGTPAASEPITPPTTLHNAARVSNGISNLPASVDYGVAPANGATSFTWTWAASNCTVQASIIAAFIPSTNSSFNGSIFSQAILKCNIVPAIPVTSTVKSFTKLTATSALQLPFSSVLRGQRKIVATASQPLYSAATSASYSKVTGGAAYTWTVTGSLFTSVKATASFGSLLTAASMAQSRINGAEIIYLYSTGTSKQYSQLSTTNTAFVLTAKLASSAFINVTTTQSYHSTIYSRVALNGSVINSAKATNKSSAQLSAQVRSIISATLKGNTANTAKFGQLLTAGLHSTSLQTANVVTPIKAKTFSQNRATAILSTQATARMQSNATMQMQYVYQSVRTYVKSSGRLGGTFNFGYRAILPSTALVRSTINTGVTAVTRGNVTLKGSYLQRLFNTGALETNASLKGTSISAMISSASIKSQRLNFASIAGVVTIASSIKAYYKMAGSAESLINTSSTSFARSRLAGNAVTPISSTLRQYSRMTGLGVVRLLVSGKSASNSFLVGSVIPLASTRSRIASVLAMYATSSLDIWAVANLPAKTSSVTTMELRQFINAQMNSSRKIVGAPINAQHGTTRSSGSVNAQAVYGMQASLLSRVQMSSREAVTWRSQATIKGNLAATGQVTIPVVFSSTIASRTRMNAVPLSIVPWTNLPVEEFYIVDIETIIVD